MVKKSLIFGLIVLMVIPTANAFVVDDNLNLQADSYSGTALVSGEVVLGKGLIQLQGLFINPNFPTERDMYLSTGNGIYLNRQYDPTFELNEKLTNLFPNGLKDIKFDGGYKTTGIMMAYSSDKLNVSYNRGESWTDETPEITEDINFANFGPKYSINPQIYFITNSGLYRMDTSSNKVAKVLASSESGSVKNFRYVSTQSVDNVFYVVNGNKVLKTENYGESWFEYTFPSKVKDFEIKQKTLTSGHLMVLTEDNKVYYATDGLTFFELNIPSEITTIHAIDYIMLTDLGFYITYNNGETWSKLDYDSDKTNAVKDYDFAQDGNSKSLYVINGNTLYRDIDLNEIFEEYMTGLDSAVSGYATSGSAVSKNLLDLNAEQFTEEYKVANATLIADGDLNGGTMDFYMTADGTNWEHVTPGVKHVFANPGRDLRWKVEMATTDTTKTPVLRSVSVDFGMDSGCAGFPDVAVDDPYCPAIEYVRAQGIFSGYPDGTFGADLEINRAETVKVITEGFNYEILADDGTNLGFSDTELGSWYMGYLNTAKTAGIIEGYPDGTFRPADTVNYVEMMKIFLETAEAELVEPATGEWYQKYVDYATANGLTVYENLDAGMKRADVAQLFYDWSNL